MPLSIQPAESVVQADSIIFPMTEELHWNLASHSSSVSMVVADGGVLLAIPSEDGEKNPVGALACYPYDNKTGFLGLFIMKEEYRGNGDGGRLFARGLEFLESRGIFDIGLDAVPAQQKTYQRRGFQSLCPVYFTMREADAQLPARVKLPDDLKPVDLKTISAKDLIESEHKIIGMLRPKLWKETEAIKDPTSSGLAVVDADGQLEGWLLCRKNTAGHKLGPLYAENDEVARFLLHETIRNLPNSGQIYAEVWGGNGQARNLFQQAGFSVLETFARMWRGSAPPEQKEDGASSTQCWNTFDAAHG